MSQPTRHYHGSTPYDNAPQSTVPLPYQIPSSPQPLPSHFIPSSPVHTPSPSRPLHPVVSTTSPVVRSAYRPYTSVIQPPSSPPPLPAPLVTVQVHRQSVRVGPYTPSSTNPSPSTGPSRHSAPQCPSHTHLADLRDVFSPCSTPRDNP